MLPAARLLLLSAALAVGACAAAPPAPAPAPAPCEAAQAPFEPEGIGLNLHDAILSDVLAAVADSTRTPLVVEPDAQPIVRCASVTLLSGGPVDRSRVLELLAEGIRPSGLVLTRTPNGLLVRRAADAPPPVACKPPSRRSEPQPVPDEAQLEADRKRMIAGIRRISAGEFEVTMEARALLFATPGGPSEARLSPSPRGGKVVGLRLSDLRAGGVLAALGLENGDLLQSASGHPIGTVEAALEAYAALQNDTRVTLQLERAGKPVELVYRIVSR